MQDQYGGESVNATGGSVMLAAGGTGGHLFPAFALAEALGRRGVPVDLVTDMRGDRYGTGFPARNVYQVPAATTSGRSPLSAAKTVLTLARGVRAAMKLLATVQPSAVVGFGGYPTFPPLMAATMKGIPTAVHEQNAVLGRANKMLARRVDAIATSFEHTRLVEGEMAGKALLTGNPVRQVVIDAAARPFEAPVPGYRFTLLVFGGSQGARYFSDAVPPALALLPEETKRRLFVIQQCREEDLERVDAAYRQAGIYAELATFFKDLPQRMADAHLVIGRAGASTVAELTVIGRPSILVPLPHAIDNDQLQNATRLAESGGGWCIEQRTLTPERLSGELQRLIDAPDVLAAAAAAAARLGRPDAVERLADLVIRLMQRQEA
ncbi:MAG: undecaprenyldiphospho-muramoylpentapeptide beta-N-acetylglucosaminyltransferase [Hyphomicrobiaceae bacterium]